jgi:hypothetical protein
VLCCAVLLRYFTFTCKVDRAQDASDRRCRCHATLVFWAVREISPQPHITSTSLAGVCTRIVLEFPALIGGVESTVESRPRFSINNPAHSTLVPLLFRVLTLTLLCSSFHRNILRVQCPLQARAGSRVAPSTGHSSSSSHYGKNSSLVIHKHVSVSSR